jgi:iron-sulfur cluster repair protein YtfE (RIC family)
LRENIREEGVLPLKEQFELQLPDLLYFVKASCHESLQDVMVDVRDLSSSIGRSQLTTFVKSFIADLQRHLLMEENHLFPSIEAGKNDAAIDAINDMTDDHEQMKSDLLFLRQLTHHYHPSLDLDEKGVHFFQRLKEMDRIILNHIQIEDEILFPMVIDHG